MGNQGGLVERTNVTLGAEGKEREKERGQGDRNDNRKSASITGGYLPAHQSKADASVAGKPPARIERELARILRKKYIWNKKLWGTIKKR